MRKQPGDMSFLGGRIDARTDQSSLVAALRETAEELEVDPQIVNAIRQLSPFIASSSFVVYVFVGIIDYDKIIHFYKIKWKRYLQYQSNGY